jgi:hypothetical protein
MPSWAIYGNEGRRRPFVSGVVGYQGLGDAVATGWIAYYGLRAFDAAAAAGEVNAIRLRRGGDNVESDFAVQTDGTIDLAAITTFSTAGGGDGNLFVHTVYDQVGSVDFVQTNTGQQPPFDVAGFGSLPAIEFTAASTHNLVSSGAAESQPFSIVSVANHATTAAQSVIFANNGVSLYYRQDADNQAAVYAGGAVSDTATASDGNWHTIQGVYNTTSTVTVDGATSSGADVGTNNLTSGAGVWGFGVNPSVGQYMNGAVAELAMNSAALDAGQLAAVDANMAAYWGV